MVSLLRSLGPDRTDVPREGETVLPVQGPRKPIEKQGLQEMLGAEKGLLNVPVCHTGGVEKAVIEGIQKKARATRSMSWRGEAPASCAAENPSSPGDQSPCLVSGTLSRSSGCPGGSLPRIRKG